MNITTKTTRSRFAAGVATAVLSIALGTTAAYAQEAAEEGVGEAIVVTGSRIARVNAEAASPVTVVGADEIKETGTTKIENLTNSLPQVFAGQSSGVANGADGTATIDLRGLGTARTLVMIDGRRLMPGGIGGGSGADLNFIPSALVSSVELLTGGASATYGADAVAGVVNFKMNRKFRGLRLDANYDFYQHTNSNAVRSIVNQRFRAPEGSNVLGGAFDVTMALGTGFNEDRGNIVAYAGYRRDSAITQDSYDYSVCTLNPNGANNNFACGGSGTPARARFGGLLDPSAVRTQQEDADGNLLFDTDGVTPLLNDPDTLASQTLLGTNGLANYSGLRDAYNFGPLNHFRRPSNRFTAGAFAEYEISDAFKPYMDVMFMDYSTKAQIAPSGAFYGVRSVNCNNPFLLANTALAALACQVPGTTLGAAPTSVLGTPTQVDILIGKRNIEGGPRFNDIGYNQFRIVTGLKGDISDAWSYDVSAQFGQIKVANTYRNDVSDAKIDEALLVGGTLANPVCLSGNPSCVPYNVFNAGGVTSAAAAYLGIPLVITGTTKETVVSGALVGDFGAYGIKSPFTDEGLKMVFGAEYRKEQLSTQPDISYINGDGAGQGGPTLPIKGQYSVKDIFTEAVLPLATDKAFAHDLSLEFGFRHSSYSVTGAAQQNSASTWKIAGNWAPIEDIKFRASRNRAVRSPNVGELFLNQSIGLFSGGDPCAGGFDVDKTTGAVLNTVNGNTAAQCARTGVSAAQFGNVDANSAEQYNQFSGGNLNLRPEKSDSWSAGVVLQPQKFLDGLTLSVDYYNIKVKDAVGTIGSQVLLDQCVNTGLAFACDKIHRAPASAGPAAGSLWLDESGFVDNQTINTGSFKSSGIDINGDYRTDIGSNKLRWQFVGTYLDKYVSQPLTGGFTYDCSGYYGTICGNPNPTYRFNTNLKFTMANDLSFTVRWRHLSGVTVDALSPDTDLGSGPASTQSAGTATSRDDKIPAYNYFDLQFALPIRDTATLRIGMNNIFDKDPPLVSQASLGGFGNGNTFPGTYDHLGRNIFVNLTADF